MQRLRAAAVAGRLSRMAPWCARCGGLSTNLRTTHSSGVSPGRLCLCLVRARVRAPLFYTVNDAGSEGSHKYQGPHVQQASCTLSS